MNPQCRNSSAALAAALATALALALPSAASAVEPGPDPYVNMYIPAFDGAKLISNELTIQPLGDFIDGVRIERRTGVYVLAGSATPVIAEHHYRVREGVGSGGEPISPEPLRALDKEYGTLVWSTAMAADRVIVKLKSGKSIDTLVASAPADTKRLDSIAEDTYTIAVPMLVGVDAMLTLLRGLADVEFAEPDYMGMTFSDPIAQWHLGRINADAALPVTGAGSVAVLDTGIVVGHPDLAGKIDTANGYNFVNNNAVLTDFSGHGTHVAGLISAKRDNGIGGRGVCPNVKIVPMRITTVSGTVPTPFYSYAVSAMTRIRTVNATGAGITVANHSWGGTGYSEALYQAVIKYAGVGGSTPPTGVTATWSNRSCVLELGGAADQRQLIKPGMKIVTGPGLKAGSRCLFTFDHTELGGAPTRMMVSDLPDNNSGSSVALTFQSNPLESENAVLSVAAAGNSKINLDVTPIYPACLPTDRVVSVGGSTNDAEALEKPTDFGAGNGSNYGYRSVDLFAPGMDMWSTYITVAGNSYASANGTSSAAALVSAAAALNRIQNPTTTIVTRKNALIAAVATPKPAGLVRKCVSEGRLKLPAW